MNSYISMLVLQGFSCISESVSFNACFVLLFFCIAILEITPASLAFDVSFACLFLYLPPCPYEPPDFIDSAFPHHCGMPFIPGGRNLAPIIDAVVLKASLAIVTPVVESVGPIYEEFCRGVIVIVLTSISLLLYVLYLATLAYLFRGHQNTLACNLDVFSTNFRGESHYII